MYLKKKTSKIVISYVDTQKQQKTKKRNLLHTQDTCFLLYQANNLRVWIMAMILQKIYISVSTQFCKNIKVTSAFNVIIS